MSSRVERRMSVSRWTTSVSRYCYLLAMYTGVRAVTNRVRSIFLPRSRVEVLDGTICQLNEALTLSIRVHSRRPPKKIINATGGGMISLYLKNPGISRSLYFLQRISSHFGCGHIEFAFYETENTVCVFGVRNILSSNLHRIGCCDWFPNLVLLTEQDEIVILKWIRETLKAHNLNAFLVQPKECVQLAVSQHLLHPRTRAHSMSNLIRKYNRIAKQTSEQLH